MSYGLTLFLLAYEFFKTGLFAVGGGLATLPFLYNISARYPEWFTPSDLANMIAVSEATPGPMGVNIASYTGFTTAGVLGAVTTTISLVLPSLIVIIIIAHFLNKFSDSRLVKHAFYGLRPAVSGLIAVAAWQVIKVSVIDMDILTQTKSLISAVDLRALLIFVVALVLSNIKRLKKIHPIVYILGGAIVGIFVF